MNFTRIGQWAQLSDCGKYTVCCIRTADAYKFEAWHLNGGPGKDKSLGTFDTAEVARDACRKHQDELLRNPRQLEGAL